MDTVGEGLGQERAASIEDVAVQAFPVDTTRQPSELVNVAFERRFSNPERNPYPAWNPLPNLIRNYQLADVVLDGQFRGLFNDRGFIRGSNYIIPDEKMMAMEVDPERLIRGPDDVTVIIGCNAASGDNYFHWVVQALPAIDVSLRRNGQNRKVALALPVLRPWQEESLQMLGYAGVRRVILDDPRGQYFFNRVEYSEFLRGEATLRWSEASHRTFSRMRVEVDDALPPDGRKLYVARTDAPTRIMRNEGALIAELRRRGFDIVVPSTLSLNEQVRTFRNASLVVGPHGAGLTNIAFCEPGAIVYELVPAAYHNACICSLAHTCGLRYWADQFHSEGKGVPLVRDWESDTELVMQRLTEIEAIQADLREEARRQTISAMDFLRGMTGRDPVADDRGSRQAASLDGVALRTIPVEITRQPPALTNVAFERRFGSPERNPFPAWNPHPNEIRNYRLSDVVLDGQFRGLFNERGYIRGTSYILTDEQMMAVAVDPARLVQDRDDSIVVIGGNHVSPESYFHWITQALPAIDFTLSRADQDRRIRLALPVLTQWQEDSLRLLGYSGVSRVTLADPSKQYSFNRVEYSALLRGEATFRWSETIHRTFSRLRAAVDHVRHEGRKLYVARTDAPRRVMRNEVPIVAELQQRGFEIVTPGILSLAEQVRLFRDASLIVGPHGAGMTNIVFCEPGTIVYELLSTHYRNACFCNLAHVCGLRYWADAFDSEGEGTPFVRDWESDTTLVMQRVTEIEAIQADLREEARQTISAMDFLRGFVGP